MTNELIKKMEELGKMYNAMTDEDVKHCIKTCIDSMHRLAEEHERNVFTYEMDADAFIKAKIKKSDAEDSDGLWVSFPLTDSDRTSIFRHLGITDEYAFDDWEYGELELGCVWQGSTIEEINEIAERMEQFKGNSWKLHKLGAYLEAFTDDLQVALDCFGDYEFYEDCSLEEYAYDKADDEGLLHELPYAIREAIDWHIASEWLAGKYFETGYGVIGND